MNLYCVNHIFTDMQKQNNRLINIKVYNRYTKITFLFRTKMTGNPRTGIYIDFQHKIPKIILSFLGKRCN